MRARNRPNNMPFTITYDNESDLLPIANNPLALVPPQTVDDETPAWQIYPLAQMWRMWNERLLITGKLQRWTAAGIIDYYVYDIMELVFDNQLGGYKFGPVEDPRKTIDDAIIETLANTQDWRVWSYIQRWIGNYCTLWINVDTQERYSDAESFIRHALAGDFPEEYGFRRSSDGLTFQYGYIKPGDIVGAWIIEDITKALSCMRISGNRFQIAAKDSFRDYASIFNATIDFNNDNYLYSDNDEEEIVGFWSNCGSSQEQRDKSILLYLNIIKTLEGVARTGRTTWIGNGNIVSGDVAVYSLNPSFAPPIRREEIFPFIGHLAFNTICLARIITSKDYAPLYYDADQMVAFSACPITEQPMPGSTTFITLFPYSLTTQNNQKIRDVIFENYSPVAAFTKENNYFKLDSTNTNYLGPSARDNNRLTWSVSLQTVASIPLFSIKGTLGEIVPLLEHFCVEKYYKNTGELYQETSC